MKNPHESKPDPDKMRILKMMVLTQMLPHDEIVKLYGCDFEFSVKNGMIELLEVWHNPKGKHKYKDKYRQSFKMKAVPVEVIYED